MTHVVLAIPTIEARPGLAQQTAARWAELTPNATVTPIITTAGTTWGDGLNDAWSQIRDQPPDIFLCASDDMVPTEGWLEAITPWLNQNLYPAPRVDDPRFIHYGGGHLTPVPDGTPGGMSTFPILRGDWLDAVFPGPEGLHYFFDNAIAALLAHRLGVQCVAVPSCRILHLHALEGRGAGYGSENTRLHVDTVRYSRFLESVGIDRMSLAESVRGHMWEDRYHEVGVALGA